VQCVISRDAFEIRMLPRDREKEKEREREKEDRTGNPVTSDLSGRSLGLLLFFNRLPLSERKQNRMKFRNPLARAIDEIGSPPLGEKLVVRIHFAGADAVLPSRLSINFSFRWLSRRRK